MHRIACRVAVGVASSARLAVRSGGALADPPPGSEVAGRATSHAPARVPGPAGERQPETLRGYRTGAAVTTRAGHPVQNAIRTGGCRNYNDLRASSTALVNAEAQLLLMPDAPPPPTKEDRDLANAFEAHVERVAALLRSGIHENQIVAVRKTSPHRGACPREACPCEGGGRGAPWPTCWPSCRPTCAGSRSRCGRTPSRRVSLTKLPDAAAIGRCARAIPRRAILRPEFVSGRTAPGHGRGGRERAG
jgi:hypothetical protein